MVAQQGPKKITTSGQTWKEGGYGVIVVMVNQGCNCMWKEEVIMVEAARSG